MFKSASRSSSTHQSLESINNLPENEELDTININMKDLNTIDNEEFFEEYNSVNLNPLGKILIKLANKTNSVISKQKEKQELINIPSLCKAFNENLECEQKQFREKLEIEKTLLKEQILSNDLNYHLVAPLINAPAYYSPIDTLTSTARIADIVRLFPRDRSRFSGLVSSNGQGVNICEFLYQMNLAQAKCKLSQKEFLERLVSCCTQEAHNFVRALVAEGDLPESIYSKLIIMYDKSPSPEQAKRLLIEYKVKRSENLAIAQAYILEKASLVAKMCSSEIERKLITNFEAIQALPRALPNRSEAEVQKQYRLLMAKLSRPPTFIELISVLAPLRVSIDEDIKTNGSFAKDFMARFQSKMPQLRFKTSTYATQYSPNIRQNIGHNTYKAYSSRGKVTSNYTNRKPTYTVNNINTSSNFKNQFINKNLNCLLCGRMGHTSSMSCYQLRDSQGRNVPNVSPSQVPCSICLKQNGTRLFHPEQYCFTKNRFPAKRGNFNKK